MILLVLHYNLSYIEITYTKIVENCVILVYISIKQIQPTAEHPSKTGVLLKYKPNLN